MELTKEQEASFKQTFPKWERTYSNITVMVLSQYPDTVDNIGKELSKFHSINGKSIEGVKEGDFIKFTLPETPYNNKNSVQQSLNDFNKHPAYSIDNIKEQEYSETNVKKFDTDLIKNIRGSMHKTTENSHSLKY